MGRGDSCGLTPPHIFKLMKLFKPIKNTLITQGYGLLNTKPELLPWYQELGLPNGHNGLDFSTFGQNGVPIYYNASIRGTVYKSGIYSDGCKYLSIIVKDGDKIYQLRYLHIQEAKVPAGKILEGGELIALSDNTGKYTTAPHLHFDLSPMVQSGNSYDYASYENGGQTDPSPFYNNTFIVDKMNGLLNQNISLIQKIIEALKQLIKK